MPDSDCPVALVTGAGSGIGLAVVKLLSEKGYSVHGVDWKQSEALDAHLKDHPGKFHQADVKDHARAHEIVDDILKTEKRLDALVNNAGISRDAMWWKMKEADFDEVIGVHVKGTFNYTQAAAKHWRNTPGGSVVNVASTAALRARPGLANYMAAKNAVIGMTKSAARELGRYAVRVNCVAPALTETPLVEKIPGEVREQIIQNIPLGRVGQPEDIAKVIAFLLSDDAAFVSGVVLRIDGGMLA